AGRLDPAGTRPESGAGHPGRRPRCAFPLGAFRDQRSIRSVPSTHPYRSQTLTLIADTPSEHDWRPARTILALRLMESRTPREACGRETLGGLRIGGDG